MSLAQTASAATAGFSHLPISRQVGLLIGLSASIALAIAVVMWSSEPSYRPLFSSLNSREASEVIDVLQRSGIEYKISNKSGTVMVPASDIHDARMKLATEGLPRSSSSSLDLLGKSSTFGSSSFMEAARYKHILAAELANTIGSFNNVKSARVHLALPKQTSFIRNKKTASASVFLDVYNGRTLNSSEIAAIVHLVASSIPNLDSNNVTVVDQNGNLLTEGSSNDNMAAANRMLRYRHQVEANYVKKIQDLLAPILGVGKVKARVTADIDFTSSEQTRESYNPDMPALRSEQIYREKNKQSDGGVGGVPGSLSNQPPADGVAQLLNSNNVNLVSRTGESSNDTRLQSTKNYELDKTISHTRYQPGQIRRLTVAVLVDDKAKVNPDSGAVDRTPIGKEELAKLSLLVKNAIGFSVQRGDNVEVINTSFLQPEPFEEAVPVSFWMQSWFIDLMKQVGGGLFVLILLFTVLRPLLKSLAKASPPALANNANQGQLTDQSMGAEPLQPPVQSYEQKMAAVKKIASEEPKRVAGVVSNWVESS